MLFNWIFWNLRILLVKFRDKNNFVKSGRPDFKRVEKMFNPKIRVGIGSKKIRFGFGTFDLIASLTRKRIVCRNLRIPVWTTECFRKSDRLPNFLWHCVHRNGFGSWHSLMCAMIVFLDEHWKVQNVQMCGFCWSWVASSCRKHSSWLTNALSQYSQKKTFLICWALKRLTFVFGRLNGSGAVKFSISDVELSSSVLWYSLDGSTTVTLSSALSIILTLTVRSASGGLAVGSTDEATTKFCSLTSHWRTFSRKSVYISVWYKQRWHMFVGRPSLTDT